MAITMEMVKELRVKTGAGILDCQKALKQSDGDIQAAVDFLRKKGLAAAAKKSGRTTNEGLVSTKISEDAKEIFMVAVLCETDFVARTDEFKALCAEMAEDLSAELKENRRAEAVPEDVVENNKEKVNAAIAKIGENMQIGDYGKFTAEENGRIYNYTHFNGKIGVALELKSENTGEALDLLGKNICLHIAAMGPEYVRPDEIPADVLNKEREIYTEQMKESGKPANVVEKIVEGKVNKFCEDKCVIKQVYALDTSKKITDMLKEAGKELGCEVDIIRFARVAIGD